MNLRVIIPCLQVDNPDQRMASDAALFCYIYGLLIADLIVVPVAIAYYAYQAYSRTGKNNYTSYKYGTVQTVPSGSVIL